MNARHAFTVSAKPMGLRVQLLSTNRQPVADRRIEISTDVRARSESTDWQGQFAEPIRHTTERATLLVEGARLVLQVGHLDPVPEPTGVKARLSNLGYPAGPPDVDDLDALRFSLELFQNDSGLPITGELDEATRQTLWEAHGV